HRSRRHGRRQPRSRRRPLQPGNRLPRRQRDRRGRPAADPLPLRQPGRVPPLRLGAIDHDGDAATLLSVFYVKLLAGVTMHFAISLATSVTVIFSVAQVKADFVIIPTLPGANACLMSDVSTD